MRVRFPVGLVVISPVMKERFTLHPQHIAGEQFNCVYKECCLCEGGISDSAPYDVLVRESELQGSPNEKQKWYEVVFAHNHCVTNPTVAQRRFLEEEGFTPCTLS